MNRIKLSLLMMILSCQVLIGQNKTISMNLADSETKAPISDAHVFIENTSFGAISDQNGQVSFIIPESLSADMYISHIAYYIKLVTSRIYKKNTRDLIIELTPQSVIIPELIVKASRSKKWKKQYKKFTQAFLGQDKLAKQCKILNPEVLRFEEDENEFIATAVDLIQIENPYLAYDIYYLLYQLVIKADGSSEYLGKARFIDKATQNTSQEVDDRRLNTYLSSSKYFFKSLIEDKLDDHGFKAELVQYNNGEFVSQSDFIRDQYFKAGSNGKKFTVQFPDFLQVYNLNSRSVSYSAAGVRPGGLESSRFSAGGREEKAIHNFDKSQIFKKSPYIILNQYGNILNSKDIKEYGFWADQKVAHMLPYEYGNDYETPIDNIEPEEVKKDESVLKDRAFEALISFIYGEDREKKAENLAWIESNWDDQYIGPFVELMRLSQDTWLLDKVNRILADKYNIDPRINYYDALQWMWQQDYEQGELYYKFKAELYKNLDPVFLKYFQGRERQSQIRLDEVVWGGVFQDGIPPLRNPELIKADEANYLDDDNIIFGLFVNGEAKAYPKRILAWHEFFTDKFGDKTIAGVYCTLCGTVIAYNMYDQENQFHDLGTSGFLYQSNKLMYDKATQSLWSTIEGEPVIGPLKGKNIKLSTFPVVTSTWGEWKKRHPDTKVLSLNTGHDRDYGEGIAYQEYFSTDRLMFPVRKSDNRLKNKAEVFIIRADNYQNDPLAISVDYLEKKRWYSDIISETPFVVITDETGASRAYQTIDVKFKKYKNGILTDENGATWTQKENFLINEAGKRLNRIAAHNIFWFAWHNVYPETRLVK